MRSNLLEQAMALSMRSGEVQLWLLEPERVLALAKVAVPDLQQSLAPGAALPQPWTLERVGQRQALLTLLGRYSGLGPKQLRLEQGPHGKPCLAPGQPGPRFSVSRSGGWVLAAFSQEEVGVDLEYSQGAGPFPESLAARVFSEPELAWWQGQRNQADRQRAFLTLWTRKEATLKLNGVGLPGLDALREPAGTGVWLEDLALPPFLAGCVALHRPPALLRLRRWGGTD